MSQFDEKMELFKTDLSEKLNISFDEKLLTAVAKGLGPSLYNADSSTVACSNADELETVKKNFLVKKLGLSESDDLDGALKDVCEQMGSSNRNKHRAIFYYLLVKKFGKESIYS
ncbi:MAG: DUF2853 family protein [Flavobacteriales bacterium]|nr:DUF2853 family protein [Flavobacteriales bacterium]